MCIPVRGVHRWVVIYDITDPKRLHDVAKCLESYGRRVQKSVFEIFGNDNTIQRVHDIVVEKVLDPDSVVFIPLCTEDVAKIERFGKSKSNDSDTIDNDTLFL